MKRLTKILVPTDFSFNSETAFGYALKLADEINATVTVVHVFHPNALEVIEKKGITKFDLQKSRRDKLNKFIETGVTKKRGEEIKIDKIGRELIYGFAAEELVSLSKTGKYDMIVMGSTGASGIVEKVFGKVSSHVAINAKCPVLLIPVGVIHRDIKNIMYACNYESAGEKVLSRIEEISKLLKAKVHLVKVFDKDDDFELEDFFNIDFEEDELEKLEENKKHLEMLEKVFRKKAPSLKFKIYSVENDKVTTGLQEFAEDHDMEWMVLVKPKRKLWERLTRKSATNELIMNPQIPVMVIH